MSITIRWKNSNTASAIVQIFRSTVNDPDYKDNFVDPIATLPGDATEFEDTTAESGLTYYYAVKITLNATSIWSPLFNIDSMRSRGPGGSKILRGDSRLGYMGTVPAVMLPSIYEIIDSTKSFSGITRLPWHKFIRKGKIIFVPTWGPSGNTGIKARAISESIGVDNGIDWGVDVSSFWPNSGKGTIITDKGYSYRPRLPRGTPDGTPMTAENINKFDTLSLNPETEFNELIIPLFSENPLENSIGSVNLINYNLVKDSNGFTCAERSGQNESSFRTRCYGDALYNTLVHSDGVSKFRTNASMRADSVSQMVAIILELIED